MITHLESAPALEQWLRAVGHPDVPCLDVHAAPIGDCTGCDGLDPHPASVVVVVGLAPKPFEPLGGGWSEALCVPGLPEYLAYAKDVERFEGASIEIVHNDGVR